MPARQDSKPVVGLSKLTIAVITALPKLRTNAMSPVRSEIDVGGTMAAIGASEVTRLLSMQLNRLKTAQSAGTDVQVTLVAQGGGGGRGGGMLLQVTSVAQGGGGGGMLLQVTSVAQGGGGSGMLLQVTLVGQVLGVGMFLQITSVAHSTDLRPSSGSSSQLKTVATKVNNTIANMVNFTIFSF
jgi:hypothetical protein